MDSYIDKLFYIYEFTILFTNYIFGKLFGQ